MRNRVSKTIDDVSNRFNPTNDYFRIALHEQTGADITVTGQLDGTAFSDTVTLQGSPADTVWTGQPGWFNNEGDNYAFLEAITQIESIMTPANYANGGLLFLVGLWLDSGRTPVSEYTTIMQYGRRLASVGGYSLEASNGTNANFTAVAAFPSGSLSSSSKNISALTDQFIPAHVFYNFAVATESLVGTSDNLAETVTWNTGGGTLPTEVPANFDIGLNCGVLTGPAADTILNSTANINFKHHDIWCIAFDTVPTSAKLQEIISDFAANPYEKLVSIP